MILYWLTNLHPWYVKIGFNYLLAKCRQPSEDRLDKPIFGNSGIELRVNEIRYDANFLTSSSLVEVSLVSANRLLLPTFTQAVISN